MQLVRPKPVTPTTVLIARDRQTGKSKSITVYDSNPADIIAEVKRVFSSKKRSRSPVPAA